MSIDNDHFIYNGIAGIQLDTIHKKLRCICMSKSTFKEYVFEIGHS